MHKRVRDLIQWTGVDRSVSPVIGVILVVALTLIIAAAIGASAFGLAGSLSESPPQATIDAEHEDRIINDGEGH